MWITRTIISGDVFWSVQTAMMEIFAKIRGGGRDEF